MFWSGRSIALVKRGSPTLGALVAEAETDETGNTTTADASLGRKFLRLQVMKTNDCLPMGRNAGLLRL